MDELRHEDDQGLWEVVWALNSQCPDVPLAEKIALARAVVFELLESGQIELREIAWPEHEGPILTATQIARLHHDDGPWYDPQNSADLLVQINERDTLPISCFDVLCRGPGRRRAIGSGNLAPWCSTLPWS